MQVKTDFGTYEVKIKTSRYKWGNGLAILLDSPTEGPFATLTVNLESCPTAPGYAFVDTNNCPWAPAFIEENDLGKYTGLVGYSGYCEYPLYKFDMDKLQEVSDDSEC